jgi:hypothetical protein
VVLVYKLREGAVGDDMVHALLPRDAAHGTTSEWHAEQVALSWVSAVGCKVDRAARFVDELARGLVDSPAARGELCAYRAVGVVHGKVLEAARLR